MMATNFAHGLSSRGVPLEGSGSVRYTGWWGATTWFVDYDHGNDGNSGKEPTKAMQNLQTALDAAASNDVIYIRNRDQNTSSTDGETILPESTTNWSTSASKTHLSIIGASNVSHIPYQGGAYSVILRGTATATATPVLTVNSGFTLIENLGFHKGSSTAGGLINLAGTSTTLAALGSVVNNCLFRLYDLNTHAAIYNVDNWFITIHGCDFHDCNAGIMMYGSSSTIRRSRISNCIFRNQTAASVSANIILSGSNGQDVTISDCDFLGEVPTATDHTSITTAGCIVATSAIQGTVIRCNYSDDSVEGTAAAAITANGLTQVACDQAKWTADAGRGGLEGS